ITDFGAGKEIGVTTSHRNGVMGAICYLDPQRCGNKEYNENYKLQKPSDIYSLGVIFWQIFSGRSPFENERQKLDKNDHKSYEKGLWDLFDKISKGQREIANENTPEKFVTLYQAC